MDRRAFLAALSGALTSACVGGADVSTGSSAGPTVTTPASSSTTSTTERTLVAPLEPPPGELPEGVFGLGVASGDPDGSSVVLWTRLVTDEAGLPSAVQLLWEVAYDPDFNELAATGVTDVGEGFGHAAHVLATGLPSNASFYYRFRVGSLTSPTGRTRTLAAAGQPLDQLRLAVSSCQLMETGHWAAHADIADADIDLVLWLGDFIYGGGGSSQLEGRAHRGGDPVGLAGYRARYRQYREDPLLQASSAAHPWMVTWDDHEVVNNYDATVDPVRRAAAYQAWWEHQPTRLAAPGLDGFDVFRSVDAGDLCRIAVLDQRQYADDTTLLGQKQQDWLAGELANDQRWTLLGSPVLVGGLLVPVQDEVLLPYTFDGYPDERKWLAGELAKQPNRLIASGDLHSAAVLEVTADPADLDQPTVATEFMAPPISSEFPADFAGLVGFIPLANPHVERVDVVNGWLRLDITPDRTTAEFRVVADVSDPNSRVASSGRYEVVAGDPTPVEL